MSKYLLLTGATGLVGRYLMRDLMEAGFRIAVVVRPTSRSSAQERIESIMQMWESRDGRSYSRPVCLEGDVTQPGLALSDESRGWLARHCDRVLHNAAILQFTGADPEGEPWHTNVSGTKNVLELCRELDVREFDYVSTAYVCGKRPGPILESDFDCGQAFRNDYEDSKFRSEQLVRNDRFIRPATIFRPGVIAGDSTDGYTNTYHGIYVYMRLISMLLDLIEPEEDGRKYTPFRAAVTGNEQRNVVCVDWVSAAMTHLLGTTGANSLTFHLTPSEPMTAKDLIGAGHSFYNSYGVEYVGPDFDWKGQEPSIFEQAYLLDTETYREYEGSDPQFDRTNLEQWAGHLRSPAIDEAMLHRFWKFGESDRWGKRRAPSSQIESWASEVLGERVSESSSFPVSVEDGEERIQGFDVAGPGGGQFHTVASAQGIEVRRGLPLNGAKITRTSVRELREMRSLLRAAT